jgi:ATP-binding cassette subfamily F protein 3
MEEASKAFGEIFGMKADIDEINEQLTIRTDYESDAYMKLKRVSDLSEKFYAIEEVNYEAEVEKILGLGFVQTFTRQTTEFSEDGECELSWLKSFCKNRI